MTVYFFLLIYVIRSDFPGCIKVYFPSHTHQKKKKEEEEEEEEEKKQQQENQQQHKKRKTTHTFVTIV